MYRTFLKFYLPAAALTVLPAIYCMLCSSAWEWFLLLRFAGGAAAVWVVWETARLPVARNWRRIIGGCTGLYWFAFSVAEAISFQHSGNTFDLKYLHHLSVASLQEGAAGSLQTVWAGGIVLFAGIAGAAWLAGRPVRQESRTAFVSWGIGILLMLAASPAGAAAELLYRVRQAAAVSEIAPGKISAAGIKMPWLDRDHVNAAAGRNLVLIYLESLENHYFDEKRFPGLLPHLSKLRAESIDFVNMTPARNADFTFGGFYSSLTGSVLTAAHYAVSGTPDGRNNSGYDPDLGSRLAGLPGVLRNAGYFQMLLVGHDPRFSGLDIFAGGAGYDKVFSALHIWRELGYKEFPHAIWGVRDRVLLNLGSAACKELTMRQDRPFHLTLITVDSHHPDGFIEPDGPRYSGRGKNVPDLLHAIHAMDQAIGRFVQDLRQLPVWKDTVVVFLTDHLAMRNSLWRELQDGQERKLVFFAVNAGSARKVDTAGKTFDVAPTVLALLGATHNAVFPLGENLLAAPDPRRLLGDLPENEPCLTGVLRQYSGGELPVGFEVSFRMKPYPALILGGRSIPLFTEWGIPKPPQGEELFVVRLSAARRILEARRFASPADWQHYSARQPADCSYVILSAEGKGGLLIRTGTPGNWQEVRPEIAPL